MTTVQEIEKAILSPAPEQLAEFRAWFEDFETKLFDAKIGATPGRENSTSSRRKPWPN